jgi:hypothetical protein
LRLPGPFAVEAVRAWLEASEAEAREEETVGTAAVNAAAMSTVAVN